MIEPAEFYRAVGANIRRARQAAGVKQCELAAAIGIARAQMCRLEQGQRMINADLFGLLAALLAVPAVSLLPEHRCQSAC